jgi:Kef-type K+ transport system membrane component KefB
VQNIADLSMKAVMFAVAGVEVESVLLKVLVQLAVILAAARVVGRLFRRFLGQPQVVGEIAAGLLLGPSFFGKFFSDTFAAVFPESVAPIFMVLSQIGLVLMMFLIGLEFDFGHLRLHRGATAAISVTGIALPFVLGLMLAHLMHPVVAAHVPLLAFSLFMATALSITALPILGRIMVEFNIARTRLGAITITSAAFDDALGWIILAVVAAVARHQFEPLRSLGMLGATAAYAAFMIAVARPWLTKFFTKNLRADGEISHNMLAIVLILVLISALITSVIGIFAIFGAFLFGAILHDQENFRRAVNRRLHDFVTVFFLPIFFTYTGLRTDIGTMTSWTLWGFCALVFAAAMAGKFGGCYVAARMSGLPHREAACVGTMMNTRALMELVVINLGYQLGVLPKNVFFMLVVMALVTTIMATPMLRRWIRGGELEAAYKESEFARELAPR